MRVEYGTKKAPAFADNKQHDALTSLLRRWRMPKQIAKRARVILESEQGMCNLQISKCILLDHPQVGVWRERWIDQRERLRLVESEQTDELEAVILEILREHLLNGRIPASSATLKSTPFQS